MNRSTINAYEDNYNNTFIEAFNSRESCEFKNENDFKKSFKKPNTFLFWPQQVYFNTNA